MIKDKKILELIDVKETEEKGKRKEKSKYYTRELLEKYGVKKYIDLVLDYETIYFKDTVRCKSFEAHENKEGMSIFDTFDFSDNAYERGEIRLMEHSEYLHEEKYGKHYKKYDVDYEIIEKYIPITNEDSSMYVYLAKKTKRIVSYFLRTKLENGKIGETYWDSAILADNFDDFIDKLYIEKTEEKPMTKEEKSKLTKFVDGLMENLKKINK